MTARFAGTHGNIVDRKSQHRDGSDGKPALTVIENLKEKAKAYTIGYIDGHAGVPLQEPSHRFWEPSKPKPVYDCAVAESMDAEGLDPKQVIASSLQGIPSQCVASRAIGAIVGSLVADAAAQPTHWNYAFKTLHATLKEMGRWEKPEFLRPSINAFYRVPTGTNSCYGDQAFLVLQSLVATGGCNPTDIQARFLEGFREGGSLEQYSGPINRGQNNAGDLPLDGGWRHGSVIQFLKNMEKGQTWPNCGGEDNQIDCAIKIVPVVALYAGRPELPQMVEQAIRVTQNNEVAVAFGLDFARLLEATILGEVPGAAIRSLFAEGSMEDWAASLTPARVAMGYAEGVLDMCGGRPMPGLA